MHLKKITLVSFQFPPQIGGLSNYADEVAKCLQKNKLLNFVLAPNHNTKESKNKINYITSSKFRDYRLAHNNRIKNSSLLIKKLGSIFFHVQTILLGLTWGIRFKLNRDKIIITSCYLKNEMLFINSVRILKVKYKIVLHGLDIINNKNVNSKLFRKILENSSEIILNSNQTKELLLNEFKTIKTPTTVLHPIIDIHSIESIHYKNEIDLEIKFNLKLKNKTIIFSISNLVKRKGIDLLIKSYNIFEKTHPNSILIIAGEGPEKKKLQLLVNKFGLQEKIKLLGYISDVEKFSFMKQSKFFVLPSRSLDKNDFEGFGIVFSEASYMKNIVIGGDHGGVKESIIDGKTGYRLNFENPESVSNLAKLLISKINDNDSVNKLLSNSKNYVTDNFSQFELSKLTQNF